MMKLNNIDTIRCNSAGNNHANNLDNGNDTTTYISNATTSAYRIR